MIDKFSINPVEAPLLLPFVLISIRPKEREIHDRIHPIPFIMHLLFLSSIIEHVIG